MHLTRHATRNLTIALAAAAALSALAPAAFADHDHGRGRGNGWGHRRGGYDRRAICYAPQRRDYCARPVYAAAPCEPRYVTYRPSRVLIVRPAPFVRIGGRIGAVDISAVFGPRRQYSRYEYGCNFCDAHFPTYGGYQNHVERCEHRPANVRIQVNSWGDGGYGDCRAGSYDDGRDDRRYDRRDDGRYDDQQYDDEQYDDEDGGR